VALLVSHIIRHKTHKCLTIVFVLSDFPRLIANLSSMLCSWLLIFGRCPSESSIHSKSLMYLLIFLKKHSEMNFKQIWSLWSKNSFSMN